MSADVRIRDVLDRAMAGVRAQLERDLTECTDELRREADAQNAQLRETAQRQADEIARAAEAQLGELRSTFGAQLDEARTTAHAQAEEARTTAHAQVEEARRTADVRVEEVERRAAAELDEVRNALDAARRERDAAHAALEDARADAQAAAHVAKVEAETAGAAQLAAARADAEKRMQEQRARLLDAIRALDEARSLGETLDVLADCAARYAERAAVLIVKGGRLRGRRLAGFAAAAPVDLDLEAAGLAGAVVRTGVSVSRPDVQPGEATRQPALPPFAADAGPRHAVALPLIVGGQVVALLYADAAQTDAPDASGWPTMLEVLARHAGRALEAMTVGRAAGLAPPRPAPQAAASAAASSDADGTVQEEAARRYARLLVSEIRMYHEPLVDEGRRSRDLRTRLGGEIDRARQLYDARVPPAVRQRSDYFEQELVRTLADGDRSLLG